MFYNKCLWSCSDKFSSFYSGMIYYASIFFAVYLHNYNAYKDFKILGNCLRCHNHQTRVGFLLKVFWIRIKPLFFLPFDDSVNLCGINLNNSMRNENIRYLFCSKERTKECHLRSLYSAKNCKQLATLTGFSKRQEGLGCDV